MLLPIFTTDGSNLGGVYLKRRLRISLVTAALLAFVYMAPAPAVGQKAPAAATAPNANKDAAPAQPIPRLPDGHPNLNGFYASSSGPDTPVGATFGPRPPRTGVGRGGNGAKARAADPNQPPYKPELLAKVKELAAFESKYDPAFFCKQGGVPRVGPPHAIIQAPGMPIVFLYQVIAGNTFRLIPMDGRPHDRDADPSYYGDSIGHWDGDTLVVDTVSFNDDTWIGIDGWFHSTALHVIERITREGDAIRYQATLEDPNVFTGPWTMNPRIAKSTTDLIMENPPCIETDEKHITDFGEKTKTN
jgi:hypothetical protein